MFLLAIKNLRRGLRRSIIAVLGIAVVTATILLVNGIEFSASTVPVSGNTSLLVVQKSTAPQASLLASADSHYFSDDVAEQLLTHSDISHAYPALWTQTITDGRSVTVYGVTPDFLHDEKSNLHVAKGSTDGFGTDPIILLGSDVASRVNASVGSTVTIQTTDYHVAGVLERSGTSDDRIAYTYLPSLQKTLNQDGMINTLFVRADNKQSAQSIINQEYPDLVIQSPNAGDAATNRLPGYVRTSLLIIAALAGAIVIMLTFVSSIYDRTRELATMRALGFGGRQLSAMLYVECAILCSIGVLVGCLLTTVISNVVPSVTAPWTGQTIALAISPVAFGIPLICALAAGCIACSIPTWRITRMNLITALRNA